MLVAGRSTCCRTNRTTDDDGWEKRRAKNVILFLGDGAGVSSLNAASIFGYGRPQALYLQRIAESGDAIAQAELADARDILGLADADAATLEHRLDAFVEQAPPERDRALVRYFHRRQLRRLQLLRDYPGPIVTRGLAPLDHVFPDAYPQPVAD